MMVSERADGDVFVERWAQVHQWIIGLRCFQDCLSGICA